jgi:benzylsuccinate CoA-transferase BbsF subunit
MLMQKQAFEGLNIVDFGWAIVCPTIAKYFADHGATVIHVESSQKVCPLRVTPPFKDRKVGLNRSYYFSLMNTNKYGLALNLNHARAREIAERLIAWGDVVTESFTPGTMAGWGLAYDDLRKIKPDIIMLSTSQMGQFGRRSTIAAYGTQLVSMAGFTHMAGWPDRGPTGPYGPYTDIPPPPIGAAAIAAALDYRRRTGRGIHIDLSQYEASLNFLAPVLMDYMVNNRLQHAQGNRCPYAAPHGIFPCNGDDRWCAIAVFADEEWQNLCNAMGNPEWAAQPAFATLLERKKHEDELERLLAQWTINYDAEELMTKLQRAGVPAGMVENGEDIQNDPQLAHRGYLWELVHTEIGKHSYDGPPFRLSKTPAYLYKAGPCLGEDSEYVCTKLLRVPDELFAELFAEGVFE